MLLIERVMGLGLIIMAFVLLQLSTLLWARIISKKAIQASKDQTTALILTGFGIFHAQNNPLKLELQFYDVNSNTDSITMSVMLRLVCLMRFQDGVGLVLRISKCLMQCFTGNSYCTNGDLML